MEWVKAYYDRILAAAVLVLLLGSLLYLVMLVGGAKSMRQNLERELADLKPEYQHASKIDVSPYREAMKTLERPHTLNYKGWTNSLTIPETRVWCVDCKMPIPFDARVCTFCDHVQPKPRGERDDWDKDGMNDEWERKHGLDPNDPSDAMADTDEDGYRNLEEFRAGTDPNDPEDFPPPEKDLWLVRLDAERFPLEFFSRARMPDGSRQFGINSATLDQTYFVKLGDKITVRFGGKDEVFVVSDYKAKTNMVFKRSLGQKVKKDVSELTLSTNGENVTLVKDQERIFRKYSAICNFHREDKEFRVREGDQFVLKGIEYQVLNIDTEERILLIKKLRTGEEIKIKKAPRRASKPEPEK